MTKIKEYFKSSYEVLIASIIFIVIITSNYDFYKAIILMLEFIVIMEVVKMISDFIKKQKLRLRFVIDIFIIFLIRDVIINVSHPDKNYFSILFLLFTILIFFIFRILAIKYSPGIIKPNKKIEEKNKESE